MAKFFRIVLSFILSIHLILTPSLALALSGDTAEWDKKYKYDKGGVLVGGSKGDLVSSIKVNPLSSKVGAFLKKGGHNALIGLALTEMLGKAVDYVLDPKNNQVVVKSDGYRWLAYNTLMEDTYFDTKEQGGEFNCNYAYQLHLSYFRKITDDIYEVICSNDSSAWTVDRVKDDRKEKLISLEEVAKKLKEMAKQGNQQAQELELEIVKEMGKNKELEKDLDKNAKDKQQEKQKCIKKGFKLDPFTLLCLPDFDDDEPRPEKDDCDKCQKLSQIVDNTQQTAQNTEQIAQNTQEIKDSTNAIKDKIDDLSDWMKEKPNQKEQEKSEIKEIEIENTQKVNFDGQCPSPISVTINVMGYNHDISYSWQPLCNFVVATKPFVVSSGLLSAMFILSGLRRGD